MLRLRLLVGTLTLVAVSGVPSAPAEATSTGTDASQLVCPETADPGQPAVPGTRTNEELMAGETFERAMTDVLRLGIAVRFCELRPDTLTLDIGDGALTSASTEYNLSRLYAAYRAVTEYGPETALELRHQDRLAGWYTPAGLTWTEKPAPAPAAPVESEGSTATARGGLYFNAGAGGAAVDQQCRDCDFESEMGLSGYLALGGFIHPKTVLGIEGSGWTKDESGVSTQVYSALAQVTRFFSSSSGLFLRAGVGLVGYRDDQERSASGPGFAGRVGYELLRGKAHIVPYFGYVRTFDGIDLEREGNDAGFNFVISQFQLGLGVSVY